MTKLDPKQPNGMPCWVDLTTDDPEAARAFYGALFDWTFDVGGPEMGHYAMCKVGGRLAAARGGSAPATLVARQPPRTAIAASDTRGANGTSH